MRTIKTGSAECGELRPQDIEGSVTRTKNRIRRGTRIAERVRVMVDKDKLHLFHEPFQLLTVTEQGELTSFDITHVELLPSPLRPQAKYADLTVLEIVFQRQTFISHAELRIRKLKALLD